ncbi:MAG: TlpA disulfide reductase family protein [Steroidobacteraceae bacterium]
MNARGVLAALAAVALGGGAGYLGYRWQVAATGAPVLRPAGAGNPAGAAAGGNAPGATAGDAAASPKVPETLPDIRLAGLDGQPRTLRDFGHRPLIVNFWATWCEPCRREMPLLTALRGEYRADGLEVVGIAVDFRDSVADFQKKTPLDYPLLVGEEDGIEAARAFGMQMVLPFSVFVDERDRIIALKVGELHRDEADAILGAMRALRAGQVSLADTRSRIEERLKALAEARHAGAPG